jgi:sugar phosphate isomerase/epimerase
MSIRQCPVILHCNYVEQGQSVEQMCQLAVRWGYEGVEFRRRLADHTAQQYVDRIAAAADRAKLKHVMFGGPGVDLMTADADARRRQIDEAAEFYRIATKRFALSVCNIMAGSLVSSKEANLHFEKNGSAMATEDHWRQAAEGFAQLGDLAAELGFRFAFEVHMNYLHDLPGPARQLVDRINRASVGINLDYGNITLHARGGSLADAVKTCGDRLFMVHLKNYFLPQDPLRRVFVACGLGDGVINNREFLRLLAQGGFTGPIVLEAPRSGDREWFAVQDLAYFKAVRDEIDG